MVRSVPALDRCGRSGGLSGFAYESTQGIQFRDLVQDVTRWSAEQVSVNGSHIARVHLGERGLLTCYDLIGDVDPKTLGGHPGTGEERWCAIFSVRRPA